MNISPTKLVVVVFPFVPVIPTNIGLFDNVYANSTSPIIFTLDSFNFSINGKSSGTPGETIVKSISLISSGWLPNIYSTLFNPFNCDNISSNFSLGLISVTTILAPNLSNFFRNFN